MKNLLGDPQLTQLKSTVNYAAINKQQLKQTQQLNKTKQIQSKLIASQPVFKMSRFANVGSRITNNMNNNTNAINNNTTKNSNNVKKFNNKIANNRASIPAQPTENFYFDDVPTSTVYNNENIYNSPPTAPYNNQADNNNYHNDNDESIYNAFSSMSVKAPVVAVHTDNINNDIKDNSISSQSHQRKSSQPSTQRQISVTRKATLDMNNESYIESHQQPSVQKNYERDNALAVINARTSRNNSADQPTAYKHSNHGQVPAYLQQRKSELEQIKLAKQAELSAERVPAGTVRMSEQDRLDTLQSLNQQLNILNAELAQFPLRVTTEARRIARQTQENKIQEIENAIQLFSKKVVYISK